MTSKFSPLSLKAICFFTLLLFFLTTTGKNTFAADPSLPQYTVVSGELVISAIEIPGADIMQGRLQRLDTYDLQFQLSQLSRSTHTETNDNRYDPATGQVHLPDVEVTSQSQETSHFQVTMQWIPGSDPLRFMVRQATSLSDQTN